MPGMHPRESARAWGQIVAKAWADPTFKKRLLADPAAVLKEHGLEVAHGVQVRIVEDTDTVHHLTLPAPPSEALELSEEQLGTVAGGISWTRWLCFGCQKTKGPTTR